MPNDTAFTHVDPDLQPILQELRSREPIFHTQRFGRSLEDFQRSTAPEFWEVGASGRRYSRDFILSMRAKDELVDADTAGWKASAFGLRRLGERTFLLTYTLDQAGRLTRRATIWENIPEGWRILYHQGTIVTSPEDDVVPT